MDKLYFRHDDKYMPIGKIVEINTTEEPSELYPNVSITNTELICCVTLGRKSKKAFAKIFMMPRWKLTEWMFPRKKKRARKRKKRRDLALLDQQGIYPEAVKKIICRKLAERFNNATL